MDSDKNNQVQPFLRWAGSKRKQLPILKKYWNKSFERYVEPFMGSACLFFSLNPRRALLGDINDELVNTFRVVKNNPEALALKLAGMKNSKELYYNLRAEQASELKSAVDSAARFIFLNRFCFNGLFRTNLSGNFNVPYSPSGTGALPGATNLHSASRRLKKAAIKTADFEEIVALSGEGDFVYLDPPFAVGNRRIFRQYGPDTFGLDDLQRLADSLVALDSRKGSFVLSYAYCSEALSLFSRWSYKKHFVRRNIAGFAGSRRLAAELIFTNILQSDI